MRCQNRVRMCPLCRQITSAGKTDGPWACGNPNCGVELRACKNYLEHSFCNRGVVQEGNELCNYCQLNRVLPDLTDIGNRKKWRKLERAKHRVLYDLEGLGFPLHGQKPELYFEFKSGATSHAHGCVSVDLAEADSVHRERIRVKFREPHRTLVGHLRHELGHYYWEVVVAPNCLDDFREAFGDERQPRYSVAKDAYYASETNEHWQQEFVSEYATMHPWEDFAETFGTFLDIVALLNTTQHFGWSQFDPHDFKSMLTAYQRVGVAANEMNRDMGMLDLVPEVFTPPVARKLEFIDRLRRR